MLEYVRTNELCKCARHLGEAAALQRREQLMMNNVTKQNNRISQSLSPSNSKQRNVWNPTVAIT